MKKNKGTKRALLGSALVLLLCLAMLIGSTFAWFTDSASTSVNQIQSGNLDVELYAVNGDTETPVTDTTKLFRDGALWEPGHAEVVTLKIANLGTLALKYRLGINIAKEVPGTNVAGVSFKLSDYIKFALIEGKKTYTDRAAAVAEAEGANPVSISALDGNFDGTLLPSGKATEEIPSQRYVTLIVYMPTTVGNEANYKTGTAAPTIDLGISLEATQVPYEEDSFGPDYDEGAWNSLTAVKVEGEKTIQQALQEALDEGSGNVQLTETVNVSYSDSYSKAIKAPENKEAKVDFAGNELNITSKDGKNGVKAMPGSTLTLSNGTIMMNKAFGSSEGVVDADESVIILDHMTVTNAAKDGVCVSAGSDGGKVTIKDSSVTGGGKYSAAVFCGSGSSVVIENSTIDGCIRGMVNSTIELRGGDYTKAILDGESKTNIIVYSGVFSMDPSASTECKVAAGSTVTDNGDGTWTVAANS